MINYKLCILILAFATPMWCEEETTTTTTSCKEGTDEYCGLCVLDKCSVCYASFANSDGMCEAPTTATDYCVQYNNATTCSTCSAGYRFTANKCEAITVENCLSSSDNTNCDSCDGLHDKDDEKKCSGTKCTVENCASCKTVSDKEECSGCASGYGLKDDKTCMKLEGATEGCGLVADKCGACMYGYYVNSASSVTPMTCKESTKYSSVQVMAISMFTLLTAFLRFK